MGFGVTSLRDAAEVAGYWAENTGGYQWVSGFWADARASELTYVPPLRNAGSRANIPQPSEDHIWVPGSWSYVNANTAGRPVTTRGQTELHVGPRPVCLDAARLCLCPRLHGLPVWRTVESASAPCGSVARGRLWIRSPAWSVHSVLDRKSGFLIHLFVRPRCRNFILR